MAPTAVANMELETLDPPAAFEAGERLEPILSNHELNLELAAQEAEGVKQLLPRHDTYDTRQEASVRPEARKPLDGLADDARDDQSRCPGRG